MSFSAYHKRPALMQPVFKAVSTPCHVGRGLAGHPRCVRVGNGYGKTRLSSPIRSKTTAFPLCARHHSAQRECSSPLRRGDESAGKRSHRNHSSSPERVRLLQPLLPCPQKRRWPATYSRSIYSRSPESRTDEKVIQDDHFETDPHANMPRGLVHVAGSEKRILSHPGSLLSQTILEINSQRGGISIQGPTIWSHSGPIRGGFDITQDPPPQPLRLPGAQGKF